MIHMKRYEAIASHEAIIRYSENNDLVRILGDLGGRQRERESGEEGEGEGVRVSQ